MACKPGDLVLIPFPYSDLQAAKKRPVMVLTPPDRHADFIGLAITSVEQQNTAFQIGPTHLVQGALPKPCWIRFDKVFTLSESSIVKTFGAVSPQTIQAVLQGLCSVVGYARK
ncbi:MAG: type II toxin-antitoxin system PemK/MazF family toxin [Nitrospira sp.]|jgi:mRNA interferase MazF